MDASALVVLRCCGSDVLAFAEALAVALRWARPTRHVIVEAADGDVMWRPPAHAPTIAVRLVFVCGERTDPSRVQAPAASRPVHLTALVVAPDGHDPTHVAPVLALPRVFAGVVGVAGAAAMLHGLLDGEEREEGRDTDEWLTPGESDEAALPGVDDGGPPPCLVALDSTTGLEAFDPAPPVAAPVPTLAPPPLQPVAPGPAGAPTTPPPAASVPPMPPHAPPAAAATDRPRRAGATSPPAPPTGAPASPAAKVKKGLQRIAGAVEDLAASVVNDWILRAPAETADGDAAAAAPAVAPPALDASSAPRVPVALGASAPRTAAPGGEFTARFIAHVPGRERAVGARLADLSPDARTHLHAKPCQWAPGTAVTVTLRARGLQVEPPARTFTWHGDEYVEEFDVTVPADLAPGTLVLRFDAAIAGIVVATLRVDLVVTAEAAARKARTSATTTAARTAFASYASADRARVLDRIAAVQTSAGLDVFVDCLSLNPGEAWRARLADEIRQRDVFLLFWSASASASSDVAWECRTAIDARGVEAVQLHPLEPDVRPPVELADQHAGDALMRASRATPPRIDA